MLKRLFDKITRGSLRFRWVTLGLSVLLLVAGILSLPQFNQELIPPVEFPQSVILTFYQGASQDEVLNAITVPIENAVRDIDGVVYVESNTGSGYSAVIISSEYGLDQDAVRDEISQAIGEISYPEDVEAPELLAFSLSDLPVAMISASSGSLSLQELKDLVEKEVMPELEAVDQVARVGVSGGQELPSTVEAVVEVPAEPAATATPEPTPLPTAEPTATATPTEEPAATATAELSPSQDETTSSREETEVESVPLPDSWIQAAAAQGVALETTADLSPEVVAGIAAYAPEMLAELTPDMLIAMPLDALAALPTEYVEGLEEGTQKTVLKRLAALEEEQQATVEEPGDAPPLPESWLAMAEEAGAQLPFAVATAADLQQNPMNLPVSDLLNLLVGSGMLPDPGALLSDLTPEIALYWAEADPGFWAGLAPETAELLSADVQALIPDDVVTEAESGGEDEIPDDSPLLPESWLALAEEVESPVPLEFTTAADLQNNSFGMGVAELLNLLVSSGMLPDPGALLGDLTPEIMLWWADADPGLWSALSPDVVALLPEDILEIVPGEVLVEIEEAAAEAEALAAESPALPESWTGPDSPFETTADILSNPFGLSPGQLLNFAAAGENPESITDLTSENILWLAEQDPGFLATLEAGTLRLFAPDVLSALPTDYMDSLEPEVRTELEGIAAGTITAFLPTETINRTNGQPSLMLRVYKNSEANTVSVSHAVYDKLDEIAMAHSGLRFDVTFEQSSFIEESISGVAREGGLGAVFAVLVILLFLSGHINGRYTLSWRSTLVTGVSIPLSVLMGFALMKWLPPVGNSILAPMVESWGDAAVIGPALSFLTTLFPTDVTLNIMTLSGMTVAVGRVVDDSIVVLENIYRYIQRGEDPRQSVIDGTRDVAIPIFASTVTTVVVFLPIGLMGGLMGNFFLPFGMTVTYALGSSFVVAITIVPVLAYLFIRKQHLPAEKEESALQRFYSPVLRWALDHRLWTLVIASVVFLTSLWLLAQRPRSFMPDLGEQTINVVVDLPNGATMAETDALMQEMEQVLAEMGGIEVYQTEIGSSGGMESAMFASGVDQSVANVEVSVTSIKEIDQLTSDVRQEAEAVFGVGNVTVSAGGLTAGSTEGFDLVVTGDTAQLAELEDEFIATLESVDGLVNVSSNLSNGDAIVRIDGQPAVSFSGEIESEDTMGVLAAGKAAVEAMPELPTDAGVSEGFVAEMQTEGFAQSSQALLISIVVVYVVMVVTFGSFVHPFVILFSLPLALVGASLGLWMTNKVLGISALVGMMMLVGIVVTNAIILVDRVRINRRERGMSIYDALIEAGRTRLRPILMTAIAAILALVPLGLGLTEGALIASDLAVVVIGGLTTSTLLTLLVVPVAYSIIESAVGRLRRR